jgi:voltage-gated potassium channel
MCTAYPRPSRYCGSPFDVEAGGLSDGASALFLITGSIHADSGRDLSLGTAAPVLKQFGFSAREGGTSPYTTQVPAEWTLSDAAIERIEKIRDGGNLVLYPTVQYALIAPGTSMPDWPQAQRPIRMPFPGQPTAVRIDAHQWVQNVREQWQLAAAVSLIVALPAGTTTEEHKTIVTRLALVAFQVRAIIASRFPGLRAIEALATSVPLFLALFAGTYVVIARLSPGSFTAPLSRTDALYFTVTVFSTVGFGDITAKTEIARLVVTGQMIADLVILGLAIKAIVGAVRRGRQRQPQDASNAQLTE